MVSKPVRISIIIFDRYRHCAGGKCLRAMRNQEGAFRIYAEEEVELVYYAKCDGCPDGNIEYASDKIGKTGTKAVHLATGMIVGYTPCLYIHTFTSLLEKRYSVKVVIGTHPIPEKYLEIYTPLGTWEDPAWHPMLEQSIGCNEP
jgi:predicted metal-binding protein